MTALSAFRPLGRSSSPVVPTVPRASGPVQAFGRTFIDSRGPFNATGCSLFWAGWGAKYNWPKLEANLAFAARYCQYVRIFGEVGIDGHWSDRVISRSWPDYWAVFDHLFERLGHYGLLVSIALNVRPGDDVFADQWAEYVERRRAQILLVAVANEPFQNGWNDPAQLARMAHRIRERTSVPIATGAPPDREVCKWLQHFTGPRAVAQLHYDRGGDDPWKYVRQPWGYPGEYRDREEYKGPLPELALNEEPKGPSSSASSDSDPLRLAMAHASTFVSGNAAYCLHTGGGIRGGGIEDLRIGRKANLHEEDLAIWEGLRSVQEILPQGLAGWERHNAQWPSMPWSGSKEAVDRGDVLRVNFATRGNEGYGVVLDAKRPHAITARVRITLESVHPLTKVVLATVTLRAGETGTLGNHAAGYILRGKLL